MIVLKNKIENEDGLTLIELIASMTILSIVILTFLAFFTNAFHFNTINSDSIQAMNIARAQKVLIQDDTSIAASLSGTGYYTKEFNESGYQIKILINKEYVTDINSYSKLHVVHVQVFKNEKPLSETYTYYEN